LNWIKGVEADMIGMKKPKSLWEVEYLMDGHQQLKDDINEK